MSKQIVSGSHEAGHGTLQSYTKGFIYSVILTVAAFAIIGLQLLNGWLAVGAILSLALAQLLVQLVFFLHLGRDASQRWNVTVFVFMGIIVLIVVIGSLWIMQNLDYSHDHRSPEQINNFILHDEGYQK